MNGFLVYKLMGAFAKCPHCFNDKIGNSKGKLIIDTDLFYRGCPCGFELTLTKQEGVDLLKEAEEKGVSIYEIYCEK